MTNPITSAGALNPMVSARPGTANPEAADLHRVAAEFEAMLLRQLLSASKVGSDAGGYSEMAVDALATGISQAGGIGLTRHLEAALGGQTMPGTGDGLISRSSSVEVGRSGARRKPT